MFKLIFTNKFKKDVKLLQRRGYEFELLKEAILSLESSGQLTIKNLPHKLSGNYSGYWEAHLKPDWLIIWKCIPDEQEIWLTRTGVARGHDPYRRANPYRRAMARLYV